MNSYSNSKFVIFIVGACLVGTSLIAADEGKRKRDEPESSSAANKLQQTEDVSLIQIAADDARERINQEVEFRERALVSIDKLKDLRLECTVGSLSMFDAELNVEESNVKAIDFLKACDLQALNWITDKTKRLDELGQFISRWLSALNNFHRSNANNLELMLTEGFDARKTKDLAKRLKDVWVVRQQNKIFSSEVIENGKRAYYLGEGFCVHLLTAPFDRVERFVEVALKKFPSYVRNMEDSLFGLSESVKIYIAQKSCRKFHKYPEKLKLGKSEYFNPYWVKIVEENKIRDFKGKQSAEKYECGELDVFKFKQQYSLLSRLSGASDFEDIKKNVDESLDDFVDVCLLKMQESDDSASQIFKSAKGSPWKQSLPVAVEKLRDMIESYQLSAEESINDILDVRSTSNKFNDALIADITRMIFDEPNFMLVQFFIDLLYGRLSDLNEGIFKPSIYKDKQSIEYKSLEFLLQVFSIKGYKPKPTEIKTPLLDFYYLYKISEICNVITIEAAAITNYRTKIITNANLKEATLELVGLFNNYEPDCTPDAFERRYQNGSQDDAIEYFQTCDEQTRIWLEAKISRLSNYGSVVTRYLNSIGNFISEEGENLYIFSNEGKRPNILVRRLRKLWRYSLANGYGGGLLESETLEAANRTFIYGDGVCVHLQEHPFDKVGKFVETVLKYFEPSRFVSSGSLKIYAFQIICRQIFDTHKETRGNYNQEFLSPTINNIIGLVDDQLRPVTTIGQHTRKIKEDGQSRGLQCNKFGVFSLKQQYYALYLLKQDENFLKLKASIDKSTDEFVSSCLSKMASGDEVDRIYERVKNTPYEELLPIVVTQLSLTISFFQLPLDQSVNDILDIRSPGNKIRSSLMEIFDEIINHTQDLKLVRLFTGLLLGRLSDFERGIFREPIYANQDALEFKLIEFLFNVFSIKGYMPGKDVNSRLLDYYYLYKISEINNLVSIDKSIDFDLFVEIE